MHGVCPQIFPTDPTENPACLGGMAACNASGARSFRYGPMRAHVCGLHAVLADGSLLALSRDAVDLFIGSDGTLGVITELTLELLREPKVVWGVSCFFTGRTGSAETEEAAGGQES